MRLSPGRSNTDGPVHTPSTKSMTESLLGREAGGALVSVLSTLDTMGVYSRMSGISTRGIETLNTDSARLCARYESGLNKPGDDGHDGGPLGIQRG